MATRKSGEPNKHEAQVQVIEFAKSLVARDCELRLPVAFIVLTGEVPRAMVLSQMLFWHGMGDLPDDWIYKSYAEWEEETGLSEYQVRRVMKWMCAQGFLKTKVREVNRLRTHQFRLDIEKLLQWIKARMEYTPWTLLTWEGQVIQGEQWEARKQYARVIANQRPIERFMKVIDAAKELPERPRLWLESRRDSIKCSYALDPAGRESFTSDDIAAVQRFAATLPAELRWYLEQLIPAAKKDPQRSDNSEAQGQ
jgi:hypothetical protein